MRLILIGALLILTIWVIVAGLRNQRRVSIFAILIFLLPAGGLGYFEYKWTTAQDEISVAVQKISGNKDGELACERLSSGFFDVWAKDKAITTSSTKVQLKYTPCSDLLSWYNSEDKSKPTEAQINAIHLLTRETMRISGQKEEKLQECLAMKNDALMAQSLGATSNQANYISLYYRQNINSKLDGSLQNVFC